MSRIGRGIIHLGVFGENVLISTREEMKRDPFIEGPRIESKLQTIDGVIEDLGKAIAHAGTLGYNNLVTEGRPWLATLTSGREGVHRWLMGLPPRPLPMIIERIWPPR